MGHWLFSRVWIGGFFVRIDPPLACLPKGTHIEPKEHKLGPDQPSPDALEKADRIEFVKLTVEKYIPNFTQAVKDLASGRQPLLMQQDAFAAAYDDDEYVILG